MAKKNKFVNLNMLLTKAFDFCMKGEFIQAENIYKDLIQAHPNHPDILTNLGTIEIQKGNIEDGIKLLKKSIQINPNQAIVVSNIGNGLLELGQNEDALKYYDLALQYKPDYAEAFYNKARVLRELKKYPEAIESYDHALHLKPDYAEAHLNRGLILHELKKYPEAIESYDHALHLKPDYAEAHLNRGLILYELKKYPEAIESYDHALHLKPDYAEAHLNRGLILYGLKKYPEAIESYDHALHLKPDYAEAQFNLGILYLTTKNFLEGWSLYEQRFGVEKLNFLELYKERIPLINNIDEQSDRLLVAGEQGIGDQIIFASMLSELLSKNKKITLSIDSRLVEVFQRSFPEIKVISKEYTADADLFDYYINMTSIGKFFRNSMEDFKNQPYAYIEINKAKTVALKSKLRVKSQLICGISWKSYNASVGQHRSIALKELIPLFNIKDICFVDLQYGDVEEEKESLLKDHGIEIHAVDDISNTNDIEDLFSLVSLCDFVISVSNSTVHIAGSIDKTCYQLLPYHQSDFSWYWHDDEKSIWYPSVTNIRQTKMNSWRDPIESLVSMIEKNHLNA
jgi:tetratricopeptide (TPR) repeat protein